ncbi:hypothetical protein FJ251_15325 [bacterium]|nr:hypothetical protein [bacterium]
MANLGAGLAVQGPGTPRLERCTIRDNQAVGSGGGVLSEEDSQLTLVDCDLTGNRGGTGGGAGAGAGGLYLRDCRLTGNQADFGGGVGLMSTASVRIRDCVIAGNAALFWGGGLCADDAGFLLSGGRIDANTAGLEGGAAYLLDSAGQLAGCWIRDNASAGETGGLHLDGSRLSVTGSGLTGNGTAIRVTQPLAEPVDARLNWWGDSTGPFHPLENPSGQGDAVSDNVLFAPWTIETAAPTAGAALRLAARAARGGVELQMTLPVAGAVRLAVYDPTGRRVAVLREGFATAGASGLRWEGRDLSGRAVASGLYLFRLESGGRAVTARGLLIR